jgi:acyl dehydratase
VTSAADYAELAAGMDLPVVSYPVTRLSLVKYCGASGDFNPIHWNERMARAVGLPDVIAHGMFTMAQAGRFVTDWAGPGATVTEFGVRFSAPVVVPDDDTGATIEVSGTVEEKLGDGRVALALTARSAGAKVLSRVRAVVQLPAPR